MRRILLGTDGDGIVWKFCIYAFIIIRKVICFIIYIIIVWLSYRRSGLHFRFFFSSFFYNITCIIDFIIYFQKPAADCATAGNTFLPFLLLFLLRFFQIFCMMGTIREFWKSMPKQFTKSNFHDIIYV